MYETIVNSEFVEKECEGVPSVVLDRICPDAPTRDGDVSYYVIRAKSEDNPQISVFVFGGRDEDDAVSRIRTALKPFGARTRAKSPLLQ